MNSRISAWLMLSLCLAVATGAAGTAPAEGAEFKLTKGDAGVAVELDGQPFTNYLIKTGPKPILWPVIGPHQTEMTRAYPMREVAGEKKDHPHQRSFWLTHGEVNGVDFWSENAGHGSIQHQEFLQVESGPRGVIETRNLWVGPDGKKHVQDQRKLTFHAGPGYRGVDFDVTFTAAFGPVVFGDTKEGAFGVRVPTVMDVDSKQGGKIVNSEGQTDGEAWGKPAAWVDYHGPVNGQVVGVAILNHPSSLRYPTHWHVRTYGLFAANPFGLHHFQNKTEKIGEYKLEEGKSCSLRYRVLFHEGDHAAAKLAEAFERYSKEP